MKKLLLITTVGILTLPFVSGALTIRTEHRSSSGGVTAAEGSATVTGDQSSSVNVQTVVSGSNGTVQVTTEKDGVTTTETHNINGSGSGGTVIVTPPPTDNTGGRTPRGDRGTVAVASANTGSNNAQSVSTGNASARASVNTFLSKSGSVSTKITSQKGKSLAVATTRASSNSGGVHTTDLALPTMVSHIDTSNTTALNTGIAHLVARILSMFGV